VLLGAFESLVDLGVFVPIAGAQASISKEFVRYRFVLVREDIKAAVDKRGETNLGRWLKKSD
jgi:origin recognition complex subunit 4